MNDRTHFEDYRPQTAAKHSILEKYIFAFFNIVKNSAVGEAPKNLVYVDGFAGRGTYDNGDGTVSPGSPLRALERIASHRDLAAKVSTIFIEKNKANYNDLTQELARFYAGHPHIREPQHSNGTFAETMTTMLDEIEAKPDHTIAPAFIFVDPCGVDGVDFKVIERILKAQRQSEFFIFFNIDGVRRLLGAADHIKMRTLTMLLGSEVRAKQLSEQFAALDVPEKREEAVIAYYESLLTSETPAKYVVPFRIEFEGRRATSHYLIHAAQHRRGFAIMKDVMWNVGQTAEGKGGLEFVQSGMRMLFTPQWDSIKRSVLEELKTGPQIVSYFYNDLPERPDNRLARPAYRNALLELESERKIVVLDKDGRTPKPNRPKRHGRITLGENYWVRLP
ncbi:three-Cys-motif partner protein TcmP [Sandaracinus amylolyticus]|uniref:Three-Cys-motif partner protein TcmP n=1 Tax=Sandaracinus amylolyticus TaxID=927083 RepID=A0A0F6SF05_9BACT|nr:three-Cys-motif partner protein TcmP [Sandaracinus amylolyticus]AKF06104.1 hypothetical protein DB32_003253 [Sandaracinus amylolyticus]